MNREEIIASNSIQNEMEKRGWAVKGSGQKLTSNRCPMEEHRAGHLCMSIDTSAALWYCNDCKKGGSIIDFLAAADGTSARDVLLSFGASELPPVVEKKCDGPGKIVKIYDYSDATGALLYQVCRMEPKSFRQRRKDAAGKWVWNMDGVNRVLYNISALTAADVVWLVEGEKDAETLISAGFSATCNVGGAGKWEASYTETLRGKEVVLIPDNDDPGVKHMEKIQSILAGVVKSTRMLRLPQAHKDTSDFFAEFSAPRAAVDALLVLAENAEELIHGHRLPIRSIAELEREYIAFSRTILSRALNVCDWLPSTKPHIRSIVPGEVVTFLAGTGVGKTMLLQNLAVHTCMQTLLFEMELPGSLSFERFAAIALKKSGSDIFDSYYSRETVNWQATGKLDHIHVCSEPRVSVAEIERIVKHAGLKTNMKPVVVMIDYVQLIQGKGDRYERISDAMEELKMMAKATETIVVIASQIGRKKGEDTGSEVFLCDAKESGSIENSSGLVIGAWRDENIKGRMWLKIMKNTKGTSGHKVACNIGEGLTITEVPPNSK